MSWANEMGRHLKDRDNPDKIGACIGAVVSASPLHATILNGSIILNDNNTKILKGLNLQNGDSALIIASDSNQKYFIVGVF